MDPELEEQLLVALWAVAIISALWCWIPFGLMATIGTGYQSGGTEDHTAIEPDGSDLGYEQAYATFRELGYEPLGQGYMRLSFHGWYWSYRTRVYVFTSRITRQFAFIQQHPFPLVGYNQVFFATGWDQRRILMTTGSVAPLTAETPAGIMMIWATENIHELARHHQHEAAKLVANGWRPDSDLRLENLLDLAREFAGHRRGPESKAQRENFAKHLSIYLAALLAAGMFVDVTWGVPLASILVLSWYRLSTFQAQTQGGEAIRQKAAFDRLRKPVYADSTAGAL